MSNSVLGFYIWCYDNMDNVDYILHNLRESYPTSDLVISSDNGENFSSISQKYSGKYYIHGAEAHGYPQTTERYGWGATQAKIWLDRIYEACKHITNDYVMLMEEDVLVKTRFSFPAVDLIMIPNIKNPISESGMKWIGSRGGKVDYPYYSAGGGSIIKRQKFIDAYEKHLDSFLENYETIYQESMKTGNIGWGWNDSIICVLMYAENAKITSELPIDESGNENSLAPIVHKFKKFYKK